MTYDIVLVKEVCGCRSARKCLIKGISYEDVIIWRLLHRNMQGRYIVIRSHGA